MKSKSIYKNPNVQLENWCHIQHLINNCWFFFFSSFLSLVFAHPNNHILLMVWRIIKICKIKQWLLESVWSFISQQSTIYIYTPLESFLFVEIICKALLNILEFSRSNIPFNIWMGFGLKLTGKMTLWYVEFYK